MVIIYHNNECSKSNAAYTILKNSGIDFQIIEYLKTPPTQEELLALIKKLDILPEELIRKKEPLFIEKFQTVNLTPDLCIEMMLKYPILIERPIVIKGDKAIICRPPEKLLELLTIDSF